MQIMIVSRIFDLDLVMGDKSKIWYANTHNRRGLRSRVCTVPTGGPTFSERLYVAVTTLLYTKQLLLLPMYDFSIQVLRTGS